MINQLIQAVLWLCLGAGMTLFHALSIIERGSRRLMLSPRDQNVSVSQSRKTAAMLHHVIPHFPPLQGAVMLGTIAGLGWEAITAGAWSLELLNLSVWVGIMAGIVGFRRIGASVAFLKGSLDSVNDEILRNELGRVMGSHHLALLAYIITTLLELLVILL